MKHMTRSYPPENAMLREHKESTLEKNQKERQTKKKPMELNENSPTDIINKKINERLKRKEMMRKEYDKWAKTQLDPTLDK
jgi:hypothetical protein